MHDAGLHEDYTLYQAYFSARMTWLKNLKDLKTDATSSLSLNYFAVRIGQNLCSEIPHKTCSCK